MMASLAQAYSPHPGGMQPHPGMAQGHPMGVPHNPQQQPGPGMPQQMHMGVSGPGPQVTQGGAMMAGMPPGAGPSQHALQHLSPAQTQQAQQMFQQQQQAMAFANNPQLQMQQQQQMMAHRQQQAARQAMLAQQYSGMPMMPNGVPGQMTPAQFQAMRPQMAARSVNLPQHLQQQQQQAEHSLQQQQAQAQAQHQQLMMAQMQQQANAQAQAGNHQGQQGQMNPQQIQSMQQAQTTMLQQAHQHQQQQQQQQAQQQQAQAAAASQQNQAQQQAQAHNQQAQQNANAQAQAQQAQQNAQQQSNPQQQQQAQQAAAAAMLQQQQQQRQGEKMKGQCLMKLMLFADHLSGFGNHTKSLEVYMQNGAQRISAQATKNRADLEYWLIFVERFFSPKGVLRQSVWIVDENSNKQYEVTYPALARYFHTHFESGIKNMQMIMERGSEKALPNDGHYIESQKSSFVYWFDNGSQLIASGTLKAYFDADQKIELLEFVTSSHEEYLPRTRILDAARPLHEWQKEWKNLNFPPEGKQSPEMNKKKVKQMKSPPQPPPEIDLPASKVKPNMGITPSVFRFLELAEVVGQMNPLFGYSHQNPTLTPYSALEQYVQTVAANGANANQPGGPRTPGYGPVAPSPAHAHIGLPNQNSPRGIMGSPAQAPGMQLQQSHHGTSSGGPSANTSPNINNKRRRPSAVKAEEENQVNGTQNKTAVKPSPRIGGKRQKGNPA